MIQKRMRKILVGERYNFIFHISSELLNSPQLCFGYKIIIIIIVTVIFNSYSRFSFFWGDLNCFSGYSGFVYGIRNTNIDESRVSRDLFQLSPSSHSFFSFPPPLLFEKTPEKRVSHSRTIIDPRYSARNFSYRVIRTKPTRNPLQFCFTIISSIYEGVNKGRRSFKYTSMQDITRIFLLLKLTRGTSM